MLFSINVRFWPSFQVWNHYWISHKVFSLLSRFSFYLYFLHYVFSTPASAFLAVNNHTIEQCGIKKGQFMLFLTQLERVQIRFKSTPHFGESSKVVCCIHGSELPRESGHDYVTIQNPTIDRSYASFGYPFKFFGAKNAPRTLEKTVGADTMYGTVASLFPGTKNRVHRAGNEMLTWTPYVLVQRWLWLSSQAMCIRPNPEGLFQRVVLRPFRT